MICVCACVCMCVCSICAICVCWCVRLMMKRVIFFLLLWCGTPRSRCTGIQINSIERSLIVPLRPARKLKLTMEWGRERMREKEGERDKESSEKRKKEAGRDGWKRGLWRGKGWWQRWWVDKSVKKTLENKNAGTGQLTRSLCLCLGTQSSVHKEGLAHPILASIHPWLGAEERRRGGGQREERGRGWKTARSMPNNIIWMSRQTWPGCQATELS